jgi:hypothetical protein
MLILVTRKAVKDNVGCNDFINIAHAMYHQLEEVTLDTEDFLKNYLEKVEVKGEVN